MFFFEKNKGLLDNHTWILKKQFSKVFLDYETWSLKAIFLKDFWNHKRGLIFLKGHFVHQTCFFKNMFSRLRSAFFKNNIFLNDF